MGLYDALFDKTSLNVYIQYTSTNSLHTEIASQQLLPNPVDSLHWRLWTALYDVDINPDISSNSDTEYYSLCYGVVING